MGADRPSWPLSLLPQEKTCNKMRFGGKNPTQRALKWVFEGGGLRRASPLAVMATV
jgi:hypothetical protein